MKHSPKLNSIIEHKEAIILATEKKVTSKPEEHAGEGLYCTKRIMAENNGELIIMSGPAIVCLLIPNPITKEQSYGMEH